jgi:hypothetical protein
VIMVQRWTIALAVTSIITTTVVMVVRVLLTLLCRRNKADAVAIVTATSNAAPTTLVMTCVRGSVFMRLVVAAAVAITTSSTSHAPTEAWAAVAPHTRHASIMVPRTRTTTERGAPISASTGTTTTSSA